MASLSSAAAGRRVALVGRSMVDNSQLAMELGYLRIPRMSSDTEAIAQAAGGHRLPAHDRGQRGSSAKNDDVDIVWELTRKATDGDDEHLTLKATHRRIGWVPEQVELIRTDNGAPMHRLPAGSTTWPEGTKAVAEALDKAGAPIAVSKRDARAKYGVTGNDRLVRAAIKYRRESHAKAFTNAQSGTVPPSQAEPGSTGGFQHPPSGSTSPDQAKQSGSTPGSTPVPPPQLPRILP